MTFADLYDEICDYGGPSAVYGIVYKITWTTLEWTEIIYIGSKVLTGNWKAYKTSSKLCRGYWLIREPTCVILMHAVLKDPSLTSETLHKILLCRENEEILFANMNLARRDTILNRADVSGGRLPGQKRGKSRRNPKKR